MQEMFQTEQDITYEETIAEAIARATLPLVVISPIEQLHEQEGQRLAETPGYEFI